MGALLYYFQMRTSTYKSSSGEAQHQRDVMRPCSSTRLLLWVYSLQLNAEPGTYNSNEFRVTKYLKKTL